MSVRDMDEQSEEDSALSIIDAEEVDSELNLDLHSAMEGTISSSRGCDSSTN